MATYLILNVVFLVIVIAVLKTLGMFHVNRLTLWLLLLLLVLTAVFDSLIVATGIVDYNSSKTLGINIGYAPVEDFMYTVLVILLVPSIWNRLESRHAK